jgi:hypothetical protein
MRPLRISGAMAVQRGVTTPEEVFNVLAGEREPEAAEGP